MSGSSCAMAERKKTRPYETTIGTRMPLKTGMQCSRQKWYTGTFHVRLRVNE
jgi:hypothetical protein